MKTTAQVYEGNDPMSDRNLAALAEQTTIAWCFARTRDERVTLRQAALYVCSYHDMQASTRAIERAVTIVVGLAHDGLPPSLQREADEREERAST